ncbi:MAG: chitobiase/beta-hexosaminidase C-terminal domain-containing protein [Gemmatimonadaceae bacterium]
MTHTLRSMFAAATLLASGTVAGAQTQASSWHPVGGRLLTRWAADIDPSRVLPEYPRPQMVRSRWQNLNGLWQFAVVSDTTAAPPFGQDLSERILVPFAMESALSGVGRHAERIVYRRTFRVPDEVKAGERLLIHFGAVDWRATVYVNGTRLVEHTGGYSPFTVDATPALLDRNRDQELVVAVYDPTDSFGQPRGKQVSNPRDIWYTPVTGIWQTVWLEPVASSSIDRLVLTPDLNAGVLHVRVIGRGTAAAARVEAIASTHGLVVARTEGAVGGDLRLTIPAAHPWTPDDPFLYDLQLRLRDGTQLVDSVTSYFGMRSVSRGPDANGFVRIRLNGKPVFQLGPLDQGWWPDGLYTPPTDAALRNDIQLMKALGFNMVRKHIKVEPARWYYYADKLGLAVWQDMPSGWNDTPAARRDFETELRQMVEDLRSVPSIVAWVPFNEKWGQFDTKHIVSIIRQIDTTRLINDASGWQHEGAGDIIDVHRYQGPQAMFGAEGRIAVVGEFGGLGYKESGHAWAGDSWGYGGLFSSTESLADRYALLLKRLYHDRDTHGISAGVYTQLTDVEVELNGFMTYDRAIVKFDTARTAAVNRGLAPYILPELGEFTDSVRVSITQGTTTEIHYTLDGSEPTQQSPRYGKPFTLTSNTIVRAKSFVNGAATAAPEARVAYQRVAGRSPTTTRAIAGLDYEYFADTTKEPPFRLNWPVRWRVEHPETRADDLRPKKRGVVADFSLAPRDTNEMFSFRYTGYIRVPRTGVYTFLARSDDGAGMWIGDQNVFWSLGQSPKATETWGQAALQAGLQPITVTYFQAYGPMQLEMYIEGPGMPRQRIPSSMLFRDERPPPH